MDEHVCDWRMSRYWIGRMGEAVARCGVEGCNEIMPIKEANRRLNEYETLKKATEALSAKRARGIIAGYNISPMTTDYHRLTEYADILERK